jgi:hypothetical protein
MTLQRRPLCRTSADPGFRPAGQIGQDAGSKKAPRNREGSIALDADRL